MADDRVLRLYELAVEEEHHFDGVHQDRVSFYTGLMSALVTATVAGFAAIVGRGPEWPQLALLGLVPLLLLVVASNAIAGTGRFYRRFLEAVVLRAKIEQDLGLTSEPEPGEVSRRVYWAEEPLVGERYLQSRESFASSEEFVEKHMHAGYRAVIVRLFRTFQWLSAAALLCLLAATVLVALAS